MIPYLLLWIIPFLLYFVCAEKIKGSKTKVLVGLGQLNKKYSLALPAFFFILLVLLIFRSIYVGRDLTNYNIIFFGNSDKSFTEIVKNWQEVLFRVFGYVFYQITENFQWYIVVTSLISVLPIAYVYCKDKSHPFVKIAVFLNMSTFWFLFSGIRQAIAISIGVLCFYFIKNGKNVKFLIFAVIATLIHTSGFMVFALYPLHHARFKKKHLLFIIPFSAVLLFFNEYIFGFLSALFASIYDKASFEITSTGAFGSLVLFVLFVALSYFLTDEEQMDDEAYALRNILLFAVWLQCFAPLHSLAMRMNYYFIIFIPMAVGKTFSLSHKKYANVAMIAEIVICTFFILSFSWNTYNSLLSGKSALDTIPYIPFWAE